MPVATKTEAMRVEVCPLARTAALIGDVYVLLILRDLAAGPQRFTSLARSVGVNPRTLSNRLRRMEREGLVARRHYAEIPPRVEYSLTDKGESLLPILHMMRLWGEQWLMGGTPRRKRTAQGSAALETPAGA